MHMHPMPSGEDGEARRQGRAIREGDHPACTSEAKRSAEGWGHPVARRSLPCAAPGAAPLSRAKVEGEALNRERSLTLHTGACRYAAFRRGRTPPPLDSCARDRYRMAGTTALEVGPVRAAHRARPAGAKRERARNQEDQRGAVLGRPPAFAVQGVSDLFKAMPS